MTDRDERYVRRENQWDEAWPETDDNVDRHPPEELDDEGELSPFPEVSGTIDPLEAVRDAEPYVPPSDPPVLPGGDESIHTGVGFGFSTDEEAYEEPAPRSDEDIRDEALRILREDSLTSSYPLSVHVHQSVVRLAGAVQSLEDADYAVSLLGNIPGVVDVVDDTTLEPV